MPEPIYNGVLSIDKPAGITSHDVVAQVRRLMGQRQVGHAGTLDPFATGVLLVVVGSATRLADYSHDLPKTYETTITLGATSDTDDVEGKLTPQSNEVPTREEVQAALTRFMGEIAQVPPAYAAIKIAGKKMYDYARAGERVVAKARPITIYDLELLAYEYPNVTLRVTCSSGTYIRALARDLGHALGTGGYATTLTRTAIGQFTRETSTPLTSLTPEKVIHRLQPAATLVEHLPAITLSAPNVAKLQQGRAVTWETSWPTGQTLVLFTADHMLIGIGRHDASTSLLVPTKIFPSI